MNKLINNFLGVISEEDKKKNTQYTNIIELIG